MGNYLCPEKTFKPLRDYYIWAFEWQRATGKILASYERTRQDGLSKIEDADRREAEFLEWTGKEKG